MSRSQMDLDLRHRLRAAGVRLTRQRLQLARILFSGGNRHVTAEVLRHEAEQAGTPVATGTVYNTLHCFARAGLLREITVDSACNWFDTNTDSHHHFLHQRSGELEDIPEEDICVAGVPEPPAGMRVAGVHVLVRLEEDRSIR
ncbi:MAG: transcriptional repressor [Rhodospirillales bacterium]|nr:transcriptional repressor [Rhodospirillales bacterium]